MKDRTLRLISGFLLAIGVVLAFSAWSAWRNIGRTSAAADWVNHTHATIYALDRVVSTLVAGDGAARNYVGTGDDRDLLEARGEFNELVDHLESLKALTGGEPVAKQAVLELEAIATAHAEAVLKLMASRGQVGTAEWERLLRENRAGDQLRELKRLAARIRASQFELLDARDRAAYREANATRWILASCVLLNALLLGFVGWVVRDDISARQQLNNVLRAANETLEGKVQERTRDLAATNAKLTDENLERKWSAQSLEHQLRYNQVIANATTDLVFVVSKTLAVTRINPAVSLRTGLTEEEILGRPLGDRVNETDAIGHALRGGRELHGHKAMLRDRGGKEIPVTFTLVPIRDNDKVVGGAILVHLPRD